jgi:4-hydroxy-2-oxoheptanedioate aldolase
MRKSKIKEKLSRNEPAFITTLHFTDPSIYEMTSLMGFDGIWVDMEHHSTSVETSSNLMRAARVGSADIVARPAKGEFMRMCRMLEMGAQAIMYPRCTSPEEAAEVVKWAKFFPKGQRGVDGGNADGWYCGAPLTKYLNFANDETLVIIQLEDQASVDQAEAIAAIEGVDALMLGPGDFSILSGIPGQMDHAKITAATEKVAAAARNTGKHWGRPMFTPEDAKRYLEMGARLCFHGADLLLVKRGLEAMQRDFAPLGFTFENRFNS